LLAAFAAMAMFAVAGAPSIAGAEDPPVHPGDCWDIDKVAKNAAGAPITSVTLSLGQSFTIYYEVIVTERDCAPGETPHESVDVNDSFAGNLAEHLDHSQTFTYTRDIHADACGEFDVVNTADVLNSVVLDSKTVTIHVTVACDQGCTLTQGYWKTHSELGPAPFDDTWNLLPDQPAGFDPDAIQEQQDETFFYSGQTWYGVFWTSSSGGNAYYILAHQYMAAVLNKLNGASSTAAADAAIAAATAYFDNPANTPSSALNLSKSARNVLLGYATTLGNYNTGVIGPGHCDE
jgi:hypothetical protein